LNNKVIIIAEAGVNHNGSLKRAMELVKVAADAHVDYVKFQTFKAAKLVTTIADKATYQKRNTNDDDETQLSMLKKLEMPEEWHYQLKDYAEQLGIKFLSTAFDEDSVDFLDKLGIDIYKVPSGELTNKPYLLQIAKKGKPIFLSTGMADLEEIEAAIHILEKACVDRNMISVLHCNTDYPTAMDDVNLKAMNAIQNALQVNVGYSDHTLGIEVPIAAVALGASIIEKHFTLDKSLPGPDHLASLEPHELEAMVKGIRNIEKALNGTGLKIPSESESINKVIARKSIHLKRDVPSGHILSEKDLEMKRPGDGISPMEIDSILGRKVKFDLQAEHKLTLNDLQ
jgi:N-acetylneuraminate synthase/N,N'-diacetyllegionaminate synthase